MQDQYSAFSGDIHSTKLNIISNFNVTSVCDKQKSRGGNRDEHTHTQTNQNGHSSFHFQCQAWKPVAFLPLLLTFLCGTSRLWFTVHSLEFIEIRANLNFVSDALFQADEDGAALRRDFDLQVLPHSWSRQPRCLAIQDSVALDKLGLAVNLEMTLNNASISILK